MLDVMEANELLEPAEDLRNAGQFDKLRMLLQTVPKQSSVDGELGYYVALLAFMSGNVVLALATIQRAISCLSSFDNNRSWRRLSNLMGIVLIELGRLQEAEDQLTIASSSAAVVGDWEILAKTTLNLGVIADIRCEWDYAIAAFTRAQLAFEALCDNRFVAGSHHNLGMSLRQKGLLTAALTHFDYALDGYSKYGTAADLIAARSERALVLAAAGDRLQARRAAEYVLKTAQMLGQQRLIGECLRVLGVVCVRNGDELAGREWLEKALPIAQDSHMPMLEAELLEELAIIDAKEGNQESGDALMARCEGLYTKIGSEARVLRVRDRYRSASSRMVG
jgi:tetratricopeptide (TPR) repeat protein